MFCRDVLKMNNEICADIVEILHRESKKEALVYRRHALDAFGTVLQKLGIDKFKEVYDIAQEIWTEVCIGNKKLIRSI